MSGAHALTVMAGTSDDIDSRLGVPARPTVNSGITAGENASHAPSSHPRRLARKAACFAANRIHRILAPIALPRRCLSFDPAPATAAPFVRPVSVARAMAGARGPRPSLSQDCTRSGLIQAACLWRARPIMCSLAQTCYPGHVRSVPRSTRAWRFMCQGRETSLERVRDFFLVAGQFRGRKSVVAIRRCAATAA